MSAMPAEKWPVLVHDTKPLSADAELDRLIDAVAYFQELALEYPTTAVYHHMLEEARNKLHEAELKKARSRN